MISVFFVVDGPKLETQAHFLAASILQHMAGRCRFYAYVRPGTELPETLMRLFEKAGIALRSIPAPEGRDWRKPYPIGNKLLAAADEREGEIAVFLDTDVVFCGPVDFEAALGDATVAAVLSDFLTSAVPTAQDWEPLYAQMGVPMPLERPGTLRRPNLDYPPYFNAGVVLFRERTQDGNIHVGREWLDMTLDLDHQVAFAAQRDNLDQITLSALGARCGTPTKILPQRYNYNIMGWGDPEPGSCDIAHYHLIGRLWKSPTVGTPTLRALHEHMGAEDLARFVDRSRAFLRWRRAKQLLRQVG
ncbi:hypothetical protein [Celeribacter sp. SCSIO 80788]|uniref:hypothetical protein n=1 Tax=Celeribacter sp. SCSIO 80788 TaxID=3117013 RepID=UPI003DA634E9